MRGRPGTAAALIACLGKTWPMEAFAGHVASWTGTNEFKLMPDEAPATADFAADVSVAAGGDLLAVAYRWAHPADGAQDGLLTLGLSEEPSTAVALWADSWHQSPTAAVMTGRLERAVVTFVYEYAEGWVWQTVLDATDPDTLTLRMDNVVPDGDPYPAMLATLRRSR